MVTNLNKQWVVELLHCQRKSELNIIHNTSNAANMLASENKQEEIKIIEDIEESKPDILIVALGSPLADKWIHKYKDRIPAKVTFGVGGSLDVITGKVKRTPEIWKKLKLEWLHRRIIMPSRKERQKRLKIFAYRAYMEALKGSKS